MMRARALSLGIVALIVTAPSSSIEAADRGIGQSPQQADCLLIEEAARANLLSVGLLTHLIWNESRFQADVVSPKGARGVAQFMPGTAAERGLSDPLNPQEAIPQAARLLADLDRRFGNMGLAIAAYSAGSKRVSDWLDKTGSLPRETRNVVLAVTGHSPEEWVANGRLPAAETQSCLALSASLATHGSGNRDERGRPLPSMEHVGEPLPGMVQSGRLLPIIAQSGRPLFAAAQSGGSWEHHR